MTASRRHGMVCRGHAGDHAARARGGGAGAAWWEQPPLRQHAEKSESSPSRLASRAARERARARPDWGWSSSIGKEAAAARQKHCRVRRRKQRVRLKARAAEEAARRCRSNRRRRRENKKKRTPTVDSEVARWEDEFAVAIAELAQLARDGSGSDSGARACWLVCVSRREPRWA